ncbi:MAG: hypothetical protein Tsb0019_18060 [Roseibium sp.]
MREVMQMTQDPTLFTAIEWVLLAMAGLITLMLLAFAHKAEPGSPFAHREEHWVPDDETTCETPGRTRRAPRRLRPRL